MSPVIVGNIDIAMLSLWAFTLFFIGLVVYLNRESRREGYPLEDEDGRIDSTPFLDLVAPKVFKLPHGHGVALSPPPGRDPVDLAAKRMWNGAGAPYVPTGNPLVDGIGPAAYCNRAKRPDVDFEGHNRIVPIGQVSGLYVEPRDGNPVGATVVAADGKVAGTVTEVWIDRTDRIVRYLKVAIPAGRDVMVPFNMAIWKKKANKVEVDAINADQFADAPAIEAVDQITLYEEDRIMGYFGGGYLYANADRLEPLV